MKIKLNIKYNMPKCSGYTKTGERCGQNVAKKGDYCISHKNQEGTQQSERICELSRYTPSNDEIDNCIFTVMQKHKGDFLGKGAQGAAFVFDNLVIKITALNNAMDEKVWFDEACKGIDLADLDIAPKIYRYFICGKHGFIVMDQLETIKSKKVKSYEEAFTLMQRNPSDVIRYKIVEGAYIDDLRGLTREQQLGFISVLETMLNNGYLHMDNHIDNLGFIAGRPMAFDFGFTQKRETMDRRWALCFSVFQILEYCPVSILEGTEFYRVATACLNNTYKWGRPESGTAISLTELADPAKELPFLTRITKEALASGEISPDLKVGSLAYAKIIGQKNRFGPCLELIYLIRNPTNTEDVRKSVIKLAKSLKIN
jgi:hypothetical protein